MTAEFDIPEGMDHAKAIAAMDERVGSGEVDLEIDSEADVEAVDVPDTAAVLDDIEATFRRFCVLPDDHCYVAVALWVAHTHVFEAAYTTPRLLFFSSQWGSGKTRALEVLQCLAARPTDPSSRPSAALTRRVLGVEDAPKPTFLLDEVDAIWRAKQEDDRELLTILNVGYKISGTMPLLVPVKGDQWEVRFLKVFAPVAMAGIDNAAMPDTLKSRCIMIRLAKRLAHEAVEEFSEFWTPAELAPLKQRCEAWGAARVDALRMTSPADLPVVPEGVRDRAKDVWVPLLKIAEHAGGDWAWRAFDACTAFNESQAGDSDDSERVRLVADVLHIIKATGEDRINAKALRDRLLLLPDSSWDRHDYGKPMQPRWLTAELKACGINKRAMRFGPGTRGTSKGYLLADVEAWWERHGPREEEEPGPQPDVGDDDYAPRIDFESLITRQHPGGSL